MARKYHTRTQRKQQRRKAKSRWRDGYYGVDYVSKNQLKQQKQRIALAKDTPPGEPEGMPAFYASTEWKELRLAVKLRDKCQCYYCGATAQTADHIIPRKLGGPDTMDNLVACCHTCNGTVRGWAFPSLEDKRDWILWARQQDLAA